MAERTIPIDGDFHYPGDDVINPGTKRKSPRCHIVVGHIREGTYVESYRRPRGCMFVPQFPTPKVPIPTLPPPPPLPKPPTVKRIPLSIVNRLKKFSGMLKEWSKTNYSKQLAPDLFEAILKEGKALGFLDEFGWMSNRTVASEILNKVLKSAKQGKQYVLTEKEVNALLSRGMIKKAPVGTMDASRYVQNQGIKPSDLGDLELFKELFENSASRGAPTPGELREILDDAIKASAKENDEYLRQIMAWADESKAFANQADDLLTPYIQAVGKAKALKAITNAVPYIFAALDAGIGLWEGEDPLRAFGGAASALGGSVAAGAACTAAALASGAATIGTAGFTAPFAVSATIAVCGGVGGFVAGYTFDRIDETGVIRAVPKYLAKELGKVLKKLPLPGNSPTPTPTPTPSPTPSPSPTPPPSPSPTPSPTPSPSPTPPPRTLPQGIREGGKNHKGETNYISPSGAKWVRKPGSINGGYWRGGDGPKPTINPETLQPLQAKKKSDKPPTTPTPPPSDRPTSETHTCVIKKDGTGFWRRKKGTPEGTPKPSTSCP